jgi:hypothetical protein
LTASTTVGRALWVRHRPSAATTGRRYFRFYFAVVVIQGVHVIEHIVQLMQVTVFDVPSSNANGLLGYFIQFNGTAEWMHFVFNLLYLVSLYVLVVNFDRLTDSLPVPRWVPLLFLVGGAGIESWHMTEHVVIIFHVIRNSGCPCPGIGDQLLGVMDIQLHFVYNALAYTATVVPFVFVARFRRDAGMAVPWPFNRRSSGAA